MDSFSQYIQNLPPEARQQVIQKMMEKQATEQAGFPYWLKQQQIQQQARQQEEEEKDEFTLAKEQMQSGLKAGEERSKERAKLEQSPAYQAFTDYLDQQRAHTKMLMTGLETSGEIFKALPKSPKYLSELAENQDLTPDEQYALKGVKKLIENRLSELAKYEKDPQYADMLWETSGKGTRKMTDMGKYILPTLAREKDYLETLQGSLKGIDGFNPKISRKDYFQAVSDGLRYYHSAQNNPMVKESPELQSTVNFRGKGVGSPSELNETIGYIDDYVKSHANWVYVPEINMLIPGKRYEELKNMSGFILDGKKLTTTPGGQGTPAWDFLEHLPENKKKEFAAAIGSSNAIKDQNTSTEAAIQNLMIGLRLRPDMQQKIFQALPFYAGQKGLDLGKVLQNAKSKINYSAVAVDTAARRHGIDSPVEPVEQTDDQTSLAELEQLGGKKGKGTGQQPGYFERTGKDIEALAGVGAIGTGLYQGGKKIAYPLLKAAGKGFMKLPGWGKVAGLATVAAPALYELWNQRKIDEENKKRQQQDQSTGE